MRKFIGFFILLAGLAFGAFAYYPERIDRESRLAEVTSIIAAPAGDISRRMPETTGSLPAYAPKQPMIINKPVATPVTAPVPTPAPSGEAAVAAASTPAEARPAAATGTAPANGWQAIVTAGPGIAPAGVTSSKPGDDHARYELVMNIQRELKRAGCYGGTASGSWNAITKRAMSAFMERANATLPIDEPDYILLTLIKGQTAATCVSCPPGQSLADGRCMPNAIIAQSSKKPAKPEEPRAAAAAKPVETVFTTTTAVAEADTSAVAAAAKAAPPMAPLPGRMSMGGPAIEPPATGAATGESWKVKIIPTPNRAAAPAAAVAPAVPAATPPGPTKTAALTDDDTPPANADSSSDQSGDEAARAPRPAAPQAGLPGSKSGRTVRAPSYPVWSPPAAPRAVYSAPSSSRRVQRAAPRVRVSAPSRPQRDYAPSAHSRSVQNFFQHPLGRM